MNINRGVGEGYGIEFVLYAFGDKCILALMEKYSGVVCIRLKVE